MRRAGLVILALAALSCDPRKFNDVADTAWVQIAERNDTQTGGDFGVDVIAMPLASSDEGARFVVTAGSGPPGLAQITYNAKGSKTEQIGYDADQNGKGALAPMTTVAPLTGLQALSASQFLVGVGGLNNPAPRVLSYDVGLKNGISLIASPEQATGDALAVGDLGLGGAAPDLVAVGSLSLTLVADADPQSTPITCILKPPNASTDVVVSKQVLQIARFGAAAHDSIVVSTRPLNDSDPGAPARILIIDATTVQNGRDCPSTTSFNVPAPGPVAIAVGDVDGNSAPDIVTGTLGAKGSGANGTVRVYLNVQPGQQPQEMVIPLSEEEDANASTANGAHILIANIDEDKTSNEIIVSDAGALLDGVSAGGIVRVYRFGGTCDADHERGPACLKYELYDPGAKKNEYFGRSLAVAPFKSSKGTTNILAVGLKDRVWVYFRVSASATDPRD